MFLHLIISKLLKTMFSYLLLVINKSTQYEFLMIFNILQRPEGSVQSQGSGWKANLRSVEELLF